jgi:hypothetical protein
MYILIMCIYVYSSYNESKNKYLNSEHYYSNLKIATKIDFIYIYIYIYN